MNRASPSAAKFTKLLDIPLKESAGWDPFFLQIVDETPLHARVLFRDLALGVKSSDGISVGSCPLSPTSRDD
jgi:hypothetical protein